MSIYVNVGFAFALFADYKRNTAFGLTQVTNFVFPAINRLMLHLNLPFAHYD